MKTLLVVLVSLFSLQVLADKYIVSFPATNQTFIEQFNEMSKTLMQNVRVFGVSNPAEQIPQPKYVYQAINSFSANLTKEQQVQLIAMGVDLSPVRTERLLDYTYGLTNIHVPELNAAHPNINGDGVVVGVIDSGFDATHPDLQGRLLAFKDFVAGETTLTDELGHGTHVTGTISGGNASGTQIGIAPKVKVVMAKVFDESGESSDDMILAAMQWMMAYDGTNHPALVSNSWGGPQSQQDLQKEPLYKMTMAWIAKNMVPVFANGNSGSAAGSTEIPGGYPEVIGVGAVDSSNVVADFSSRGPITWLVKGLIFKKKKQFMKPDVSAPGVGVYSSLPGGTYGSYSGTSMATPHVAGVVALMLQANPRLTPAQVKSILCKTAHKAGDANSYGCGVIDAKAAVEVATKAYGRNEQ